MRTLPGSIGTKVSFLRLRLLVTRSAISEFQSYDDVCGNGLALPDRAQAFHRFRFQRNGSQFGAEELRDPAADSVGMGRELRIFEKHDGIEVRETPAHRVDLGEHFRNELLARPAAMLRLIV